MPIPILAAALPYIIKGLVAIGSSIAGNAAKKNSAEKQGMLQQNQQALSMGNNMMMQRGDMQQYLKIMNYFKQ